MTSTRNDSERIGLVDVARGVALVAMAIYHFGFDLTLFGYAEPEFATTGPMRSFARSIATTFLVLVGVGLVLGHVNGIRWQSFWRRWLAVAACAALITIATWFAIPERFIYFGILHHIAVASLVGLVFLRLHWSLLALLAIVVSAVGLTFSSPTANHGVFLWTGLGETARPSNDYVPFFPWFGAILAGMAFAKSTAFAVVTRAKFTKPRIGTRLLTWLGRRSLIFYMLHQPVLIGLIYVATLIAPPKAQDEFAFPPDPFLDACESTCLQSSGADFCIAYCACMDLGLQRAELKTPLIEGRLAVDDPAIVDMTNQCTADIASALEALSGDSE
ncbi:MAG: heparan-alpha-glucosaminide N-acetyltransferase [Pseudomonadota bacterium]